MCRGEKKNHPFCPAFLRPHPNVSTLQWLNAYDPLGLCEGTEQVKHLQLRQAWVFPNIFSYAVTPTPPSHSSCGEAPGLKAFPAGRGYLAEFHGGHEMSWFQGRSTRRHLSFRSKTQTTLCSSTVSKAFCKTKLQNTRGCSRAHKTCLVEGNQFDLENSPPTSAACCHSQLCLQRLHCAALQGLLQPRWDLRATRPVSCSPANSSPFFVETTSSFPLCTFPASPLFSRIPWPICYQRTGDQAHGLDCWY